MEKATKIEHDRVFISPCEVTRWRMKLAAVNRSQRWLSEQIGWSKTMVNQAFLNRACTPALYHAIKTEMDKININY